MRIAKLLIASCLLTAASVSTASAQFVDPYKVLEAARRDRLELDKRLAREAAERRQKEKADQAANAAAQRKLDEQRASASGAISPTSSADQGAPSPDGAPVAASRSPPGSPSTAERKSPESALQEAPAAHETSAGAAPPGGLASSTPDGTTVQPSLATHPSKIDSVAAPLEASQASVAAHVLSALVQPQPTPVPIAEIARPVVEAPPRVLITIDKASQRMRVAVDGKLRHSWAVSTARAPYKTPAGTFRPLRLAKEHYSREWDDAPMPYSIFFTAAGHAIHASTAIRRLGRPASHGCVRLAPANAAALFALVRAEGPSATKVFVTNGVTAGRGARSRTAAVRTRARAHHVRHAPTDIWQVGSGYGFTD